MRFFPQNHIILHPKTTQSNIQICTKLSYAFHISIPVLAQKRYELPFKKRHNKDTLNTNIQIKPLKIMKKNYLEPTMKLHQLKTERIMAASLGQADTTTSNQNPNPQDNGGVEDFEVQSSVW